VKIYSDTGVAFSIVSEAFFDKQNEIYHNEDKAKLITKKNGEIFRLNERVSDLLKQYEKTQNKEILKTAVNMQVKEIIPETRNLRSLKTGVMEIIKNEQENILFQYPVELSKIDHTFGEPARVIKFNK
jgi:hypothetical protein